MKRLLLFLLFIGLFSSGYAQTQAEYEQVIAKFMKFYNARESDSIKNLFSYEWGSDKNALWPVKQIEELTIRYGKMRSYRFIELYKPTDGDSSGDGLAFFKTKFNRSEHMTGISLDKQNKILTFRFKTSSPHIDNLLERSK